MICCDCGGMLVFGPALQSCKVTEYLKEGKRTVVEHRCELCSARHIYDLLSEDRDISKHAWGYFHQQERERAGRHRQ